MLIPILKGTTEILEKVKDGEVLEKACIECQGDLVLKQFRTWNTLFMIPLTPSTDTREVYECANCDQTFDIVYRKTFINRATYRNATAQEVKELTDTFSIIIFASVVCADDRPVDGRIDILKDFAIARRIDIDKNAEKFEAEFLTQNKLPDLVFEWYDIFRDCFIEDYRSKALQQVLHFARSVSLSEKEMKLLYTYCRHWGLTKNQFDEMFKK